MASSSRATLAAVVLARAAAAASGADRPCPSAECDAAILAHRTLGAGLVHGAPPVLDGRLDDAAWAEAPVASGFVQNSPRPAAPATLRSEARVLVDGEAVYVALRYHDPEPSRILAPMPRRDDETTSDWAFVEIDSRYDRRTGFSFGVNPRGVQVDGLWLGDTGYDFSWNAVWQSAARLDEQGWTGRRVIRGSGASSRTSTTSTCPRRLASDDSKPHPTWRPGPRARTARDPRFRCGPAATSRWAWARTSA